MAIDIGGATTTFSSAYKIKLELGSTRLMTRYMIHDLSYIIAQIKKSSGIEMSGNLGSANLKRNGIIIDYKHKRIVVPVSRKGAKREMFSIYPKDTFSLKWQEN